LLPSAVDGDHSDSEYADDESEDDETDINSPGHPPFPIFDERGPIHPSVVHAMLAAISGEPAMGNEYDDDDVFEHPEMAFATDFEGALSALQPSSPPAEVDNEDDLPPLAEVSDSDSDDNSIEESEDSEISEDSEQDAISPQMLVAIPAPSTNGLLSLVAPIVPISSSRVQYFESTPDPEPASDHSTAGILRQQSPNSSAAGRPSAATVSPEVPATHSSTNDNRANSFLGTGRLLIPLDIARPSASASQPSPTSAS
jgi:hypothetical protein